MITTTKTNTTTSWVWAECITWMILKNPSQWKIFDGHVKTGKIVVFLPVGFWEHLEQIPTVIVTFVEATFVLATFVHIGNISAITHPNFLNPIFLQALDQNFVWSKILFNPNLFEPKNLLNPKLFWTPNLVDPKYWESIF